MGNFGFFTSMRMLKQPPVSRREVEHEPLAITPADGRYRRGREIASITGRGLQGNVVWTQREVKPLVLGLAMLVLVLVIPVPEPGGNAAWAAR